MTIQEQQEVLKVLKPPSVEKVLVEVSSMLERYIGYRTALGQISVEWASDPFKVLIGTILSHRTKDEMTAKAAEHLFQRFKGPEDLAEADEEAVQELIRPAGFYRVKAKRIKEVAKLIVERFNGGVPQDMESLLSLPAVGRKTANCVLVYGFQTPAIPVDTHVHRISNRLNLVQTRTPEETEVRLAEKADRKYWLNINDLFVRFGQTVCRPIGPRCEVCSLREYCAYYALKVAKPQ
ncbi:MAG: endonuclease III domain-containing protein [Nitrososphaerales archaeon]